MMDDLASHPLLGRIGVRLPILQAPMAGTSTPAMAAAVTDAGGLGAIALGAADTPASLAAITELKGRTRGPFNVNLFCHRPARADPAREAGWIERLRPEFARFGAAPPAALHEIYRSFVEDDEKLAMLVAERPRVVSFHFGLPSPDRIAALRDAGAILLATATSLAEARAAQAAGIDAIVAQGHEAGGHRGLFDPDAEDDRLGTMALTRLIARTVDLPVIAAGGIMDGAGIAAVLRLGAAAAQLGTAFIACDESMADQGHRAALSGEAAHHTVMTAAISGRPARCLANGFTRIAARLPTAAIPAYPIAYDLGKALNSAAKARGDAGFGAQWAGQGAPLARAMPAGRLVETLSGELARA